MDPVSGARNWNAQYAEYDMYLMDDAERGLQNTMRRHGQQWGPMEGAAVASANEPATVVKEDAGRIGAYPGTLRAAPTYEAVLSSDSRSIAVRNCRSGRVVWRALLPSAVLAVKGIGDLALSMEDPGALADVGGSQALLPAGADAAVPATLSGAAAGMRGASVPSVAEEVCVPGSSDLYDVLQPQRRGNAYTPLSGRTPDSAPVEGSGLLLLALFLLALGAAAAGFVLWTMHRFRPNIRYWPGRIATADTSLRARDTHTQSMDAAVATETELSRETAVKRKHRKKGRLKAVADATAPAPLSPSLQLGVGADADVPPGYTRIGRLLLSSVILGLGSHGTTVFEGLLLPGRRRVAIKRLLRSFYKIARREIGVLIELDESCQHILRYYAMEEGGEFIYVALELCDGSLEDRVQRRLPPSTVCPPYRNMDAALVAAVSVERAVDGIADDPRQHHDHVAADAARPCGPPRTTVRALHGLLLGLTELHDHGIVHRDLKPANVLLALGTDDVVKIGDVGLAKRLDRGRDSFTAHDTMAGTVGWRPPEVLRHSGQSRVGVPDATTAASSSSSSSGVPAADMPPDAEPPSRLTKAIDVFSAGCVAFYLLTGGLHPFGQLLFERDANILSGTVDVGALRSWPEAYDWVMSMLQHAPERRPPVAYLLAHPFFWSRAKRLQFLTDVSDVIFEGVGYRHLRGELDRDANTLILGSNHNWTLFIDTCVLLSLRGRSYSGSSVMDLLRLMRNKRVHFREQSEEVRRVLGTLPVEDEQGMDGEVVMKRVESAFGEHVFTEAMPGRPVRSHDLYSYFAERFPNLFMYVYAFVIRTGLAGDPHFARYGLQEALAFHQQWRQARGGGGEEAALFSAPWYPRSGGGGGGGGGGESWLSAEWATPGNVAKANSPAALAASLSTLSATSQASALGGNHASRGSGAHGGDGGALHESHPLWLSSSTTTCSSSPSPRAADLSVSTGGFVPVHHRRSPRRREPERGWDDGKEAVEATASTSSPARHVYSAEQFRALRGRGTADVADPRGPFLSCSLPLSLLAHPSPVWELPRRTAVGNADAAGMFSPGTPPSASMTHRT
ncbi:hypothetical protein CDCA_CDCA20G4763 [Cyanidium caldarium]|uniref:Protein kinase domain-containing protein n=1 Tax=Cyanidium caldarium TaxID=2771 RepID=A0AAV9J2C2_CYACA|nr:hypothetical protein CDCA_CDCA20G4763 [Cyanidium caldarium]